MSRLIIAMSATILAAATVSAGLATPAQAQQGNVAEILVYGNDPCPRSTDDQVVVCSRRPEAERFRLPKNLRPSGTLQQGQSWAVRSQNLETVGRTGVNSCSAVGPAGYTGCLQKMIKQAQGERKQQADDGLPPQ